MTTACHRWIEHLQASAAHTGAIGVDPSSLGILYLLLFHNEDIVLAQAAEMLIAFFAESSKRAAEFEAYLSVKDSMATIVTLLSTESARLARVHEATMALMAEFGTIRERPLLRSSLTSLSLSLSLSLSRSVSRQPIGEMFLQCGGIAALNISLASAIPMPGSKVHAIKLLATLSSSGMQWNAMQCNAMQCACCCSLGLTSLRMW